MRQGGNGEAGPGAEASFAAWGRDGHVPRSTAACPWREVVRGAVVDGKLEALRAPARVGGLLSTVASISTEGRLVPEIIYPGSPHPLFPQPASNTTVMTCGTTPLSILSLPRAQRLQPRHGADRRPQGPASRPGHSRRRSKAAAAAVLLPCRPAHVQRYWRHWGTSPPTANTAGPARGAGAVGAGDTRRTRTSSRR